MTTSIGRVERIFNVSGPARLTLLNVSGEITIEGRAGETISVTAVKHPGRGFDRTEIEMTQAADGAVRVATRYEADLISRLFGGEACRVDYTVGVPHDTALELAYVSGPATVAHLQGALDLQTVDGPLDLAALSGTLHIKTVSGAVRATGLNLAEPLHLESVSAEVDITESRLPGAQATTVSGDLYLASDLTTGAYHLNTVSGDIALHLPAGTQGAVQLSSLTGALHSALPGVQRRAGTDTGGVIIHVSSVSGDVTLTTAANAPAPATATAPPPATAEDRLALLDRLARGEVSVDEALKNLNAQNP